jgi:outer membrane lipoprotein SlyB
MFLKQITIFATTLLLSFSAVAASCTNCGKVVEVGTVKVEGKGSGLGAVAGGVAGGLLGNQVGKGTGNTLATIAGAAGGAYAGHQVEKKVKEKTEYRVTVKMDSGENKYVSYAEKPAFIVGDRVKLENGALARIKK